MALNEDFLLGHRGLAHRFAQRYRGLLEQDDLMACADVGLCEAARDYSGDCEFGGFHLFNAVRRVVLDEVRRLRGKRGERSLVPVADEFLDRPAPEFDVTVLLDWRAAMTGLSPRLRGVVAARTIGLSQSEIGRQLNMSESRVCQLEAKARSLLRTGGVG